MTELKFQEDEWSKYKERNYWTEAEQMPVLVRLIMKAGLDRRQAYYVLFGILIVCLFITFDVTKRTFFPTEKPVYIEDIPDAIKKTLPQDVLNKIPSRKK